jgi:uncharacterized protein
MTVQICVDWDSMLEMRDGVKISADIYRPGGSSKYPAILMRSYSKNNISDNPSLVYHYVYAGYAVINSDLRGRGKSEGQWDPSKNQIVEGLDGYDSVEWIARQPWCDGNVGMAGLSHMGSFQWFTAIQKPPHLKAIAPWTTDFNTMFVPARTGGAFSFMTTLSWLPQVLGDLVNNLERQGKDVNGMRQALQWAQDNPQEFYNYLPLNEIPLAKFGQIGEIWKWRLHPLTQAELEKQRLYEEVSVPCFHECGWYDPVGWVVFENFFGMSQRGGSLSVRENQYIVAGPWPHNWQFQPTLGDLSFGHRSDTHGSGINQMQIDFFDKYLKGKEIAIPRVSYFLMGKNQWVSCESWPPPGVQWQRFYLHSLGKANTASGDGWLSQDVPGPEKPDTFDYQPLDPVPTMGGAIIGPLPVPGMIAGPVDQYIVEKRPDVLCYTTKPFDQDTEISGPLQVHLFAATSAQDTDFSAKICHVYADERSFNLGEGIMRASGRKFSEKPELIKPGEVNEYIITSGHTSQLFRKGTRIRIQISSSNFPTYDRNMNTGNPIGEDDRGVVAHQTIFHQSEFASYIDLPVIPF